MKKYLVWDLPVRLFHWSLVITLMALWYTAEQEGEMIDLHMQLGYVAAWFSDFSGNLGLYRH